MASTKDVLRPPELGQDLLIREVVVLNSSGITVQWLIGVLSSNGLTRYRFNDQGMGCRWWCEVVMRELEDKGYVEKGTVEDLNKWWIATAAGDPRVPSTKIRGSFY